MMEEELEVLADWKADLADVAEVLVFDELFVDVVCVFVCKVVYQMILWLLPPQTNILDRIHLNHRLFDLIDLLDLFADWSF